jgi:hypothetical protein
MRWYEGVKRRTLKKYQRKTKFCGKKFKYISFQDGVCYTLQKWEALLTYVESLNPGDKVWNCYTNAYDKVKEVNFYWEPLRRGWTGRAVGRIIREFDVITDSGHALCDETMYDPDYWN